MFLVSDLRVSHVWIAPSTFQKWHSLAYWNVMQDKPSYAHQGHGFHGVLLLAEQGAWSEHG